MNSVAHQFTNQARYAITLHRTSQRKSGIARIRRKKTVKRFRCRSSWLTRRIGCCAVVVPAVAASMSAPF